jgi:hypothetical protein
VDAAVDAANDEVGAALADLASQLAWERERGERTAREREERARKEARDAAMAATRDAIVQAEERQRQRAEAEIQAIVSMGIFVIAVQLFKLLLSLSSG